ncbi:BON domain-containing protein [Botrimarina hoheduenensis]|uniref:BON domain protein n=1 Tax=Botrimarina hoheduenensis TaxID=2528000 RepID=A0A5C5W744_9BACT|nr:BON domain-containing protein [Botrimarina hoheduenensis]TWT46716.1 BON domain protein [Botrimarina hoheduenensis]
MSTKLVRTFKAERFDNPVDTATGRLAESSHLFLRHVRCRQDNDTLLLEGKVPSYFLKQTAQSLVQSVEGVNRIVNHLVVVNSYGVSSDSE